MTGAILDQAMLFVPLALVAAFVASRVLRVSFGLALFALSLGLLYSLPMSLSEESASASSQRLFGVMLLGSAVVLAMEVSSGRLRLRSQPMGLLLFSMVAITAYLAVTGLVVGLLRGNPPGYLAGDALRLALSSFAVVLGFRLNAKEAVSVATVASIACVLADVTSLVQYIEGYVVEGQWFVRAGGGYPAALGLGLVLLSYGIGAGGGRGVLRSRFRSPGHRPPETFRSRSRYVLWGLAILAIDLSAGLLSLFRALWIGVVAFLLTWAAHRLVRGRGIQRTWPIGAIMVCGLAGAAVVGLTGAGEAVANRVVSVTEGGVTERSIAVRLWEMDHVRDELERLPLGWLVGKGAGATFNFTEIGEPQWHQVHNSFSLLLFRGGQVGLVLYGIWWLCAAVTGLRAVAFQHPAALWASAVILVGAVQAITSGRFIGLGLPEFAIGLAVATLPSRRHAEATSRVSSRGGRINAGL